MLVRIVKNWDYPDLMRQTPGGEGVWEGVRFTLDAVQECDFLVVLNDLRSKLEVVCPPENVWAVFQEPYVPGYNSWMRYGHEKFVRVFTCQSPNRNPRYRHSHPMVPWQVGKTFDELNALEALRKSDQICWVTSNLGVLPGHKLRHQFYEFVREMDWPELNIYGRGIEPVDDKWSVLAPAKYSIAIENYSGLYYWTEKIADCWLADSLPFYYGCLNLEKYFPADSFIRIDLSDFSQAVKTIRDACESGEYEKRRHAIAEAKRMLLEQKQLFPTLVREIKNVGQSAERRKTIVKLEPFRLGRLGVFREAFCRRLLDLRYR